MIITTTSTVPGSEISEILGIARGSVRARNIGRDIFAGLKNIVGGEIEEYTKLQTQSREQAMQRMVKERAERLERMRSSMFVLVLLWSCKAPQKCLRMVLP